MNVVGGKRAKKRAKGCDSPEKVSSPTNAKKGRKTLYLTTQQTSSVWPRSQGLLGETQKLRRGRPLELLDRYEASNSIEAIR